MKGENKLDNQCICVCGHTCKALDWPDHVRLNHPGIDLAFNFYFTSKMETQPKK